MAKSAKDMVAEAGQEVPKIGAEEAAALHGRDDVVFLDVREPGEVANGKVAGAVAIPRGLLEFQADPAAEGRPAALSPEKKVLVYCAAGGRAALAGRTLRQMGYADVRNAGGFKDLAGSGTPTD